MLTSFLQKHQLMNITTRAHIIYNNSGFISKIIYMYNLEIVLQIVELYGGLKYLCKNRTSYVKMKQTFNPLNNK